MPMGFGNDVFVSEQVIRVCRYNGTVQCTNLILHYRPKL